MNKKDQTQWAAQFLAAAELVRRGCSVGFTMGNNTPIYDLSVNHAASGANFMVNVKGNAGSGAWLTELEDAPLVKNLFFILVEVSKDRRSDRFFILRQSDVKKLVQEHKKRRGGKGALDKQGRFRGFNKTDPYPFEGRWDLLSSALKRDASSVSSARHE